MRLIEGDRPGVGDRVLLRRTGEEGQIVHVFATYPFRGDVVVEIESGLSPDSMVGERRELCSLEEIERLGEEHS